MTKISMGLMVGSLLFAGIGSAATFTEACGGATQPATAPGTTSPALSGSATCVGFSLPSLNTLQSISITVQTGFTGNDLNQVDSITFINSFTSTNFANATLTDTNASSIGTGDNGAAIGTFPGFTTCSGGAPGSQITCTITGLSITGSVANIADAISGAWNSGGLFQSGGGTGSESVFVSATFTYANLTAPEPTTLMLMGGGLIGLVLAGRRKIRG